MIGNLFFTLVATSLVYFLVSIYESLLASSALSFLSGDFDAIYHMPFVILGTSYLSLLIVLAHHGFPFASLSFIRS